MELLLLFILAVSLYLPVTLIQKIYQDLLMKCCSSMSKNLGSYFKDTTDFLRKLQNVPYVPKKAFLVTLDVTSLYSYISHNDGIKACEHILSSKPSNSGISTESLCELISTVLTKNHFQFNGDNYIQIMGCAMGTKKAPYYASLFIGKFQEDKLNQNHRQPLIWLRF